jgi:hypothetical protein
MSDKELKELKREIKSEQKEVQSSKEAATKFLIELGVLTTKGNLKKAFKPAE